MNAPQAAFPWDAHELRHALWKGAGVAFVERMGFGWYDGMCCVLVRAMQRVLGPAAQLMIVGCQWHPACHVVCLYRGHYVDGDGISTACQLLTRWERVEMQPCAYLRPFDVRLVHAAEILDDPHLVDEVVQMLRALPTRAKRA
ncbi:MAG: hypothetical protein H0X24_01160 [Ktedonobacterales bacterium]|nr:hypothetical protein [Ktedonobacterales bacterium]